MHAMGRKRVVSLHNPCLVFPLAKTRNQPRTPSIWICCTKTLYVMNTHTSHVESENGKRMYLRNVCNIVHIYEMQGPKSRINISNNIVSVQCVILPYLSPVNTKGLRPNNGSTSGSDRTSLSWKLLKSLTSTVLTSSVSRISSVGWPNLNTPPYL
jgi:hypothetical protein